MDTNDEFSLHEKTTGVENRATNPSDTMFLRDNINLFSKQLFQKYAQQFSRYNIESLWANAVKTDCDIKQFSISTKNKLSYWKYPVREMNRAVSEPNLQTVCILGTTILQKNNSFHDLCNPKQKFKPSVKLFEPKIVTWLYVTKAQCNDINFTRTANDLIKVFDDMFEWKNSNEKNIMTKLFVGIAKYCKNCDYNNEKISSLLGIYYYTHLFNKSKDVLSFKEVYEFFEELIIHHSVLTPPDHVNLFSAEEAKNLLTYFLNKYLICLPLIRHICEQNTT